MLRKAHQEKINKPQNQTNKNTKELNLIIADELYSLYEWLNDSGKDMNETGKE